MWLSYKYLVYIKDGERAIAASKAVYDEFIDRREGMDVF